MHKYLYSISNKATIINSEIRISAIRAQVAGGRQAADGRWQMADGRWQMADGQNINKVSNAIHLLFDINYPSFPNLFKEHQYP